MAQAVWVDLDYFWKDYRNAGGMKLSVIVWIFLFLMFAGGETVLLWLPLRK